MVLTSAHKYMWFFGDNLCKPFVPTEKLIEFEASELNEVF
jgi:hypothetical protein